MKWKSGKTRFEDKKKRVAVWHRWFAWYPVDCDDGYARWLQFVEARAEYTSNYGGNRIDWEYKRID